MIFEFLFGLGLGFQRLFVKHDLRITDIYVVFMNVFSAVSPVLQSAVSLKNGMIDGSLQKPTSDKEKN